MHNSAPCSDARVEQDPVIQHQLVQRVEVGPIAGVMVGQFFIEELHYRSSRFRVVNLSKNTHKGVLIKQI